MLPLIKDKVYYKFFIKDRTEKNRQKFAENLLWLKQIHSTDVVDADYLDNLETETVADASVASEHNLTLSVMTADCVPVLFSCRDGKVIGAAHCGWRSAKDGIIANTVKMMNTKGSTHIKALIGPAIRQKSYEVSNDFYNSFLTDNPIYTKFFIPGNDPDKYMFDLPDFVRFKLHESGINDITDIGEDTYTMPEKYPSYRRHCHTGEEYNKHILSTIVIKNV